MISSTPAAVDPTKTDCDEEQTVSEESQRQKPTPIQRNHETVGTGFIGTPSETPQSGLGYRSLKTSNRLHGLGQSEGERRSIEGIAVPIYKGSKMRKQRWWSSSPSPPPQPAHELKDEEKCRRLKSPSPSPGPADGSSKMREKRWWSRAHRYDIIRVQSPSQLGSQNAWLDQGSVGAVADEVNDCSRRAPLARSLLGFGRGCQRFLCQSHIPFHLCGETFNGA